MHHADPLFKYDIAAGVAFHNWFVTHKEGSHHLKYWDLNWEIERSDHADSTVWPSVTSIELAEMISGLALAVSQEANTVSTEVFKKVDGNLELSARLEVRLGDSALDHLDKEIKDLFVVHGLNDLAVDLAEHEVALFVLERVVQARFRDSLHALDKRQNFLF